MSNNPKFFVIEGLDGSGKSTQSKMLKAYLTAQEIPYKEIHFPRYNKGIFGSLISKYLQGGLRTLEQVHPQLVALLFAEDRKEFAPNIRQWLDEGYYVIADRYVNSNIAYQCAKLESSEEKKELIDWINNLEYEHYNIPKPQLSIFLHAPMSFVKKSLTEERTGEDRDYLDGKQDIHESSLELQEQVRQVYLQLVEQDPDLIKIDCYDAEGRFYPKEIIHERILKVMM